MKTKIIGKDHFLNKDIKKFIFETKKLKKSQVFNNSDVIFGNPNSNIAICFIYTWSSEYAPEQIRLLADKVSNYSAVTGFWRTTNGARYVFSNILSNPNINKILLLVFDREDNGHLLVESLTKLWTKGVDENGIINECESPNPKFEQVPIDGLNRLKKQADLLVMKSLTENDFDKIESVVKAGFQEPNNAKDVHDFEGLEFYSNVIKNDKIYDNGARFDTQFFIDLSNISKNSNVDEKNVVNGVGHSIHAKNLSDGSERVASYLFEHGSSYTDERGIVYMESHNFTLTIEDPLEQIPDHFSKIDIDNYVKKFMNGNGEKSDDFTSDYHHRIFKRWGNQVNKAIALLKNQPTTRRCLISLWDPKTDIGDSNAPCLDSIWFLIHDQEIEMHVSYHSQHLATVTKGGTLKPGKGALVPNLYALGTLQNHVAKKVQKERGSLILNDYSGRLYVSEE